MITKDGNEPAFPGDNAQSGPFYGMTLRDYFAAKAMAAFTSDIERVRTLHESAKAHRLSFGEEVAAQAYDMADAMLAERAKEKQ